MTTTLSELFDDVVRSAKAHCLEPTDLSESLRQRALAQYLRALQDPNAHCLQDCKSVGRECGIHKVCRRV